MKNYLTATLFALGTMLPAQPETVPKQFIHDVRYFAQELHKEPAFVTIEYGPIEDLERYSRDEDNASENKPLDGNYLVLKFNRQKPLPDYSLVLYNTNSHPRLLKPLPRGIQCSGLEQRLVTFFKEYQHYRASHAHLAKVD